MAKLTASARAKIPASKFAKEGRKYPVTDAGHCASAKGYAAKNNESPAVKARINKLCAAVTKGKK